MALGTISVGYGWFVMKRDATPTVQASSDHNALVLKERQASVNIQRLFEDFSSYLARTLEQHRKRIDEIAQQHVVRNTFSSGPHLRNQYAAVRETRREISSRWIDLKRRVEDVLFEVGKTGLANAELKQQFSALEQKKDETREAILDVTHQYFASRSGTFSLKDIESLRQRELSDQGADAASQ